MLNSLDTLLINSGIPFEASMAEFEYEVFF